MPRRAFVIARLCAASLAFTAPAVSADPVRLTIAQAHPQSSASDATPAFTVFLDLVDERGEPPASLDPSAIAATIGSHRATVVRAAPFPSTGEGTAYIFMVDVSQSISASDMARVRASIRQWLASSANEGHDKDRFALMAFGDDVSLASDFTGDRAAFEKAASTLAPHARTTQLHTAIRHAIELSRRRDAGLPARRVAVLLSDGQDEGSGLTADDVAALLRQERLAIHAIGYSRLHGAARARGFDALRRFAENSGGQFDDAAGDAARDLQARYARMQRAIARVFAVTLRCDACTGDGQLQRLNVEVKTGSRVLSDGIDLRLPPAAIGQTSARQRPDAMEIARTKQRERRRRAIVYWQSVGLIAIVGTAGVWYYLRARRRRAAAKASRSPGERGATDAAAAANAGGADAARAGAGGAAETRGVALTCHFRGRHVPAPLTVILRDHLIVGTDAACAIVIPNDRDVADAHCELALEQGHVTLRRIDATLPTLVNGAALAPASRYRLESGDILLVGRTELRLMFGEETM